MDYKQKYEQAIFRMNKWVEGSEITDPKEVAEFVFPELKEGEDDKIRNALIDTFQYYSASKESPYLSNISKERILAWLDKQGEMKTQGNSALEIWKDMRLEVYQQASGNRHEPNYSDDTTKMFSLNDIDEIMEKMSEQKLADKI